MAPAAFVYPPTPAVLDWIGAGQLGNRPLRAVRLWVLLDRLYGLEPNWSGILPSPFRYPDLRDRLFSSNHPTDDSLKAAHIVETCGDRRCLCHQTFDDLLFSPRTGQDPDTWARDFHYRTGFDRRTFDDLRGRSPFATVHRSLRDDLKLLCQTRWLSASDRGSYDCLHVKHLPDPPPELQSDTEFGSLSSTQRWELLRALESVAFVQPGLQVVVQRLWEQMGQGPAREFPGEARGGRGTGGISEDPPQRIFIHLDYILSDDTQDRVDDYQEQIEALWRAGGGVVQFDTWVPQENRRASVVTYPVCLHYARRAKYLSAYGPDPWGRETWHNYRLDRIASRRLRVLPWGDPAVPPGLHDRWRAGQLPTPDAVREALDEAWGFNFYLPKAWFLMRFSAEFARWYLDDTDRHPTFRRIAYGAIAKQARQCVPDPDERAQILAVLQTKSPRDAYYSGWIRLGDINIVMRLRDWRPNGEAIAPVALRKQAMAEARQELQRYGRSP